ncbi:hypothetical protein [Streptomyces sp. NBC_00258]|uniref:hypothetical protein n=1 Tax=Streptomyces sp. NBC_00258 TaxID=2903642 RepID=UPI002E2DF7D8|nr:hypothetical protein [Streptomyces sp. NBC_00258]
MANIAVNLRLEHLSPGSIPPDYLARFFQTPESGYATPLPLDAFTPASLRAQMDLAVLAVGKHRWKPGTAMNTPQPSCVQAAADHPLRLRDR